MRSTWNFFTAGQLTFGNGAVRQLPVHFSRHGWKRPLLVCDERLLDAGIVDRVVEALRQGGITPLTADAGPPEPSIVQAEKVIDFARAMKPDVIIGLGGGSNMDLAKIVAAAYTHGGSADAYFGFDNIPGPVLPLVCIPTTAGTGSEVSHAAVLTDTAQQIKVSTLSNYLRPTMAVVDPELTYTCPPQVTADSGIDALTHAIEAYTAVDYQSLPEPPRGQFAYEGRFPLGQCLAEEAIRLVGKHLVNAVQDGTNQAAREGMALAATLAGIAFSNCGVAVVHALEYPMGGVLHCSHGAGNGLLLPYVMRYNLPAREAEFARVAALLGEDISGLSQVEAARQAIVAVERLRAAIKIPHRIRDIGGKREQLPSFAEKAFAIKRLMEMNPQPVTSAADLLGILESAY